MISKEPPRQAVAPLPVAATIAELYASLFRHFGKLMLYLSVPTALSVLVLLMASVSLQPLSAYVFWYLFLAVPTMMLGVPLLRLLLLGRHNPAFILISQRRGRFLAYNFLLSLITLPLVFLQHWLLANEAGAGGDPGAGGDLGTAENPPGGRGGLPDDVIYWAAYLPLFYVQLRLSFVLPAIAVDEDYGFADSWRHTQGQAGKLFLIAVLAVLLPWVIWFYSPSFSQDPGWQLIAFVFYHLSIFLHQGALFALLAIAFRTMTGWVPPPNTGLIERFE